MAAFTYDATDKRSVNSLIGRVYGYMFFNLILTAVVAIGVGLIFNYWIFGTFNISEDLGGLVDINTAGSDLLCTIPGIGKSKAEAIISILRHTRHYLLVTDQGAAESMLHILSNEQ